MCLWMNVQLNFSLTLTATLYLTIFNMQMGVKVFSDITKNSKDASCDQLMVVKLCYLSSQKHSWSSKYSNLITLSYEEVLYLSIIEWGEWTHTWDGLVVIVVFWHIFCYQVRIQVKIIRHDYLSFIIGSKSVMNNENRME